MGYTGERSSQGEAHGQGTQTWPNGDRYEGTWQDGKRHGTGRSTLANGEKYVGQYVNDKRHGKVSALRAAATRPTAYLTLCVVVRRETTSGLTATGLRASTSRAGARASACADAVAMHSAAAVPYVRAAAVLYTRRPPAWLTSLARRTASP